MTGINYPLLTLSTNAMKVLYSRYLIRDQHGMITETPVELFRRVAKTVAGAEAIWGSEMDAQEWEDVFFEMLTSLSFLPNSPVFMNSGTRLNQLSACFVLPVPDNLEGIFTTLKQSALIQQSGGGTGFNFSHLRPQDDLLTITGGTASGPVSFMKVFNAATEHVKHGGRRRGANMGILNVDHPDIELFIDVKTKEGELNNFNTSVGITDMFMKALLKNEDWSLIHPNTHEIVKTIPATKLWNQIITSAWKCGDPGIIFLDTINKTNPLPALGLIEATNPCGEVPLLPYESCNLGSLNLTRFVNIEGVIDWNRLENIIRTAIRFLDNVIEINNYLFPEVKTKVIGSRKIGLGVMGWADLLTIKEIPYDSEEAIDLAHQLMHFINEKSFDASSILAVERDSFQQWNESEFFPYTPMRNATRLSIAPTGTISIIGNASSSIEPLFALAFDRQHILDGQSLPEINEYFIDHLKAYGLYSDTLLDEVRKTGSLEKITNVPEYTRNIFKTAHEISPEWHLRHQVAFQKYTDNAVSKTINMPEDATVGDIDYIFKKAWSDKAKGITIFRHHSKNIQILEKGISSNLPCKVCV